MWPTDAEQLVAEQHRLATLEPEAITPPPTPLVYGGCWVCFPRGLTGRGNSGDRAWASAVAMSHGRVVAQHVLAGAAGAPYTPGLLALRIGPLLHQAVDGLRTRPDVLLVDAGAADHPRAFGLALHLGVETDLPTVGVTHRPLLAQGEWPDDRLGATSPLRLDNRVVACWMRTRPGTRPLVVHPGWRVDLATAVDIVAAIARQRRTPEPLRRARRLARLARQHDPGVGGRN